MKKVLTENQLNRFFAKYGECHRVDTPEVNELNKMSQEFQNTSYTVFNLFGDGEVRIRTKQDINPVNSLKDLDRNQITQINITIQEHLYNDKYKIHEMEWKTA